MGDDFWNLLQRTKSKRVLSAMCYVVYRRGDRDDIPRLKKAVRALPKGDERSQVVQDAINWMSYRLSGDKTYPGPAAAPPTLKNNRRTVAAICYTLYHCGDHDDVGGLQKKLHALSKGR